MTTPDQRAPVRIPCVTPYETPRGVEWREISTYANLTPALAAQIMRLAEWHEAMQPDPPGHGAEAHLNAMAEIVRRGTAAIGASAQPTHDVGCAVSANEDVAPDTECTCGLSETVPTAAPGAGDEAAVEEGLSAAIQAAQNGPLSDDHVRTLLWHLRRDASELSDLRAQVAKLSGERDLLSQHHGGHLPTCGGIDEENSRCQCGYLDGTAYRELVAERDRLAAEVEKYKADLERHIHMLHVAVAERDAAVARAEAAALVAVWAGAKR